MNIALNMIRIFLTLCLLIVSLLCLSCDQDPTIEKDLLEGNYEENNRTEMDNPSSRYKKDIFSSDAIKTGNELKNSTSTENGTKSGQGIAVFNNILYRLFDTGVCQTYDITDLNHPVIIKTFKLGSYSSLNHCNDAQFMPDTDRRILYIAGLRGKCFVEEMTDTSSVLLQTITLDELDIFDQTISYNIICGQDGYLWLFGGNKSGNTLFFAKLRRPEIEEGDVRLSMSDVIDNWSEPNYVYKNNVWQGGKVYGNRLYFVFGISGSKRHVVVYDTNTHEIVQDINLESAIPYELEDCEIVNHRMIIAIYGSNGYYILEPKESTNINSLKI